MGVLTISYKTPEPLKDVQAARLPYHGATAPESWHNRSSLWHRGASSATQEATLQQAISVLGSKWGHRKKLLCVSFPLLMKFPPSPRGEDPWMTVPAYGVSSEPQRRWSTGDHVLLHRQWSSLVVFIHTPQCSSRSSLKLGFLKGLCPFSLMSVFNTFQK